MSIQLTYTQVRANFAKLLDEVSLNKEVVVIKRRNAENVALISESELSSLLETAYLLRSPNNAKRLLAAIQRALNKTKKAQTLEDLKKDLGLG